jgi:predicted nucleic acid-binding protein
MMDTSALVAALVRGHEHHARARAELPAVVSLPVIVVAETYSILRRAFGQPARVAVELLAPWSNSAALIPTSAKVMATALTRATELDLAGNIHDALIALACVEHGLPIVTLDSRQHQVALALGARSTYLLA